MQAIPLLPKSMQPGVIHAYTTALKDVFIIGAAAGAFSSRALPSPRAPTHFLTSNAGGLTSICAIPIRNLSVKGKNMAGGGAA